MKTYAALKLSNLSVIYLGSKDELVNLMKDVDDPKDILPLKYYEDAERWAVMETWI